MPSKWPSGSLTWPAGPAPNDAPLKGSIRCSRPELAARLLEEHGVVAVPAMLSGCLCRCGFRYKEQPMAA